MKVGGAEWTCPEGESVLSWVLGWFSGRLEETGEVEDEDQQSDGLTQTGQRRV